MGEALLDVPNPIDFSTLDLNWTSSDTGQLSASIPAGAPSNTVGVMIQIKLSSSTSAGKPKLELFEPGQYDSAKNFTVNYSNEDGNWSTSVVRIDSNNKVGYKRYAAGGGTHYMKAWVMGWLVDADYGEISYPVNMYSYYSDDSGASHQAGKTYTNQAEQGGDKSLWFHIPVPLKRNGTGQSFQITKIRISRSGTQTFWNKYVYEVNESGTTTLKKLNTSAYTGEYTWSNINFTLANERRYLIRLVVSVYSYGKGGGSSNPFHNLTVYGKWV